MNQIEGVIAWDVSIRLAGYSWFAPVQPAWGDCEVVDAAELGHQVPGVDRERLKVKLLEGIQELATSLSSASLDRPTQFLIEVPRPRRLARSRDAPPRCGPHDVARLRRTGERGPRRWMPSAVQTTIERHPARAARNRPPELIRFRPAERMRAALSPCWGRWSTDAKVSPDSDGTDPADAGVRMLAELMTAMLMAVPVGHDIGA